MPRSWLREAIIHTSRYFRTAIRSRRFDDETTESALEPVKRPSTSLSLSHPSFLPSRRRRRDVTLEVVSPRYASVTSYYFARYAAFVRAVRACLRGVSAAQRKHTRNAIRTPRGFSCRLLDDRTSARRDVPPMCLYVGLCVFICLSVAHMHICVCIAWSAARHVSGSTDASDS